MSSPFDRYANFEPVILRNGDLIAFSAYDAEFIAAVKAIGATLINGGGRKGWKIAASKPDQFDAFRTACANAIARRSVNQTAEKTVKQISEKTARSYALNGNCSLSAFEYETLRITLGDAAAADMARMMQG